MINVIRIVLAFGLLALATLRPVQAAPIEYPQVITVRYEALDAKAEQEVYERELLRRFRATATAGVT